MCITLTIVLQFIRGRVSKQITNGSKTAVMDVLGFICVSLGSSTVQLHDNLSSRRTCACSEAGFSSRNGDRVWGMYYQRAEFCCGQKDSMQRIFIRENFPSKAVRSRVKKFSQGRTGWNGGAEVAERRVKRFLCCGFRRTGKAMGQLCQCWWRICREVNVLLPGSNITCFTFYIHLWPIYWHSLSVCILIPISVQHTTLCTCGLSSLRLSQNRVCYLGSVTCKYGEYYMPSVHHENLCLMSLEIIN
jgi:hypothetical protein